jgi:endonuclease VIII-like 1
MPEAPEVKLMADFCNTFQGTTKVVSVQVLPISKWKDISFHVGDPAISLPLLDFHFLSHGKEMALDLYSGEDFYKRIVFQMGMSGNWMFIDEATWVESTEIRKNTTFRVLLRKNNKEGFLILHDTRRFAKWFESDSKTWGKNRGPCPYSEREEFVENVLLSLNDSAFKKPIYETLMDQRYFNGVGNWIRSVLIYKTDNEWNVLGKDYIKKNVDKIFVNLFDIIDKAQNNYKADHFPIDFFYPYGAGKSLVDSKERRFWYHGEE